MPAKYQRAGYSAYVEHERVPYVDSLPSMTRQEFQDECDVNKLMERYEGAGGVLPLPNREPMYFDTTALPTNYQELVHIMQNAEQAFMTLPAKVRKEFDNNAAAFVDFATNAENIEKLREWGLAPVPEAPPAPQKVEVVNLPASTGGSGASPGPKGDSSTVG